MGGQSLCGVPPMEAFILKIKCPPGVVFWDVSLGCLVVPQLISLRKNLFLKRIIFTMKSGKLQPVGRGFPQKYSDVSTPMDALQDDKWQPCEP